MNASLHFSLYYLDYIQENLFYLFPEFVHNLYNTTTHFNILYLFKRSDACNSSFAFRS